MIPAGTLASAVIAPGKANTLAGGHDSLPFPKVTSGPPAKYTKLLTAPHMRPAPKQSRLNVPVTDVVMGLVTFGGGLFSAFMGASTRISNSPSGTVKLKA